jgi:hypothetical protein
MRLVIVIALALAFPAAAAAKEVTSIAVCGTDGCTRIADRATLRAFEEGSEMAAAAPAGLQRSYLLRIRMREGEEGSSTHGWTSRWLPSAGLIANEDGPGNFIFTPVGPKLERALRGAARGRTARAARRFARVEPVAQVDEVVMPATATAARADAGGDGGGLPTLAWLGFAAGLLAVGGAGAVGLRRR